MKSHSLHLLQNAIEAEVFVSGVKSRIHRLRELSAARRDVWRQTQQLSIIPSC